MPVTRDTPPATLGDLIAGPPRATVTFVRDGEAEILPVRAQCTTVAYAFAADADLEGREVVLVLDDGPYWFELRGISVRGTSRGVAPGHWAIDARRIVAWDYGAIREEP